MNGPLFTMFARAFDGIASIGDYSASEGLVTVHVWPAPGHPLPSHGKVSKALAIADRIEEKTGIVVSVKTENPIRPGLGG